MPLYDYACSACGAETEIQHKMSDPAPTECPSCGNEGLERLVSPSAFTLKGGGWYADGYSSKPEKKGADAPDGKKDGKPDGGAKPDGGGKSEGGAKSDGGSKKSEGGGSAKASDAA